MSLTIQIATTVLASVISIAAVHRFARWLRRYRPKAWLPPCELGPSSFGDWTDADIATMSKAIRIHGQPDSDDWQRQARICLNALRGGSAVELVARTIDMCYNGEASAEQAVGSQHYMHGMPHWCVWVEVARPAVEAYAQMMKARAP